MRTFTDEFRREAVRLVETSGQTIGQIANDLGVGHSTLGKWLAKHRESELLAGPHEDTAKELARLRPAWQWFVETLACECRNIALRFAAPDHQVCPVASPKCVPPKAISAGWRHLYPSPAGGTATDLHPFQTDQERQMHRDGLFN